MKRYTIIGGVNGTGKSSLTGVLKTQLTDLGQIIDVDKITAQNGGSAILGGRIALERPVQKTAYNPDLKTAVPVWAMSLR